MNPEEIGKLIEAGLEGATVSVKGDGAHFEAIVVSSEFEGKRSIARHQIVYKTLGSLVGNEIHALSIRAMTPEEWQARTGNPLG
jgi:acid stress-induced BolA-like protein IbaG/YrbA